MNQQDQQVAIPSAADFFEDWCQRKGYVSIDEADDIEECMIEFTKLHLAAQSERILDRVQIKHSCSNYHTGVVIYEDSAQEIYLTVRCENGPDEHHRLEIDRESVVTVYPLTNVQ